MSIQTPERAGVEHLKALLEDIAHAVLVDLPAREYENNDAHGNDDGDHDYSGVSNRGVVGDCEGGG